MYNFNVPKMTCGHCAGVIEKSVRSADPAAQVTIDMSTRSVQVQSSLTSADVANAIRSAGYEPSLPA